MKLTNKLGVGIRIGGDFDNTLEILGWLSDVPDKIHTARYGKTLEFRVMTRRGIVEIGHIGDWIVRNSRGDLRVFTNKEMELVSLCG